MTGATILVKLLEENHVEYIFGIPGESNIIFLSELKKSKITFIHAAHEKSAGFMATTYARLTNKPGIVLTACGPSVLNLVNPIAFANKTNVPLIILSTSSDVLDAEKVFGFQKVNEAQILQSITSSQESIFSLIDLYKIREVLDTTKANNFASSYFEIDETVLSQDCRSYIPQRKQTEKPNLLDKDELVYVCEAIQNSGKVVVILGVDSVRYHVQNGIPVSTFQESIVEFVKKSNAFVIESFMAKGSFPNDHAHSLASFSLQKKDYQNFALDDADLIITLGLNVSEYDLTLLPSHPKKLISISPQRSPSHPYFIPDKILVGDVSQILKKINISLRRKTNVRQDSSVLKLLKEKVDARYLEYYDSNEVPMKPQKIVSDISQEITDGDILISDNGMHKLWLCRYFKTNKPNSLLVDNTMACMGAGIPGGIAGKLAFPERNVIVNVGDGGLIMTMGELATIKQLQLKLIILVWNDGSYGMIKWKMQKAKLNHYGTDLLPIDLGNLSKSFGFVSYRVSQHLSLKEILDLACDQNQTVLIDCPVDYSENESTFISLNTLNLPTNQSSSNYSLLSSEPSLKIKKYTSTKKKGGEVYG